ncbi:MAG: alpha/beta hydrolase, partial [Verrucomicrobiota bacterium]|nr:alpha/beta hydrolase [Verrucomicrobiota bacterium]
CHIAFAITAAIPYGYMKERLPTHLGEEFKFDDKTAPMCMLQGGKDSFGCLHSSHVYRQLRRMKISSELHYFADRTHGFWGANPDLEKGTGYDNWFENVRGFIRQMNFDGKLAAEEKIEPRFPDDSACGEHFRREVWPAGKMPDVQTNQCAPYLEWWMPKTIRTRSIQILYSGGSYMDNHPEAWDGVPAARRFLNARGMTVVTLKYRTPRPTSGIAFYQTAWQDLQRAIRLVKSEAPQHGLDPDSVGIWGSSAGGHLTLLGALSSTRPAYEPIDAADAIPCSVRWAVAVYPAYVLTEGNAGGGNQDSSVPGPEFAFDEKSCPVLFLHGDADGWTAMNSVKVWERLAAMGVQGDLHTFAKREHCFMMSASPGTGSYTWLDRVWEFMNHKGYNASSETRPSARSSPK